MLKKKRLTGEVRGAEGVEVHYIGTPCLEYRQTHHRLIEENRCSPYGPETLQVVEILELIPINVRLHNVKVIGANVDQLIAMLANRANEVQPLSIKGCIDVLKFILG